MATKFLPVESYRETLNGARRLAEETLAAAMAKLVGERVIISGQSEVNEGIIKSVETACFTQNPLYHIITFTDERRVYFFPQKENIEIVEGS